MQQLNGLKMVKQKERRFVRVDFCRLHFLGDGFCGKQRTGPNLLPLVCVL